MTEQLTRIGAVPDDWGTFVLKDRLVANDAGDWGQEPGNDACGVIRGTNFTNEGDLDLSDMAWRAYLGSYGPDFIPLVISERHGHLYAMTENMVDYRLTPLNKNVCTLPPGMYVDEQIVFLTDADGRARAVNFANMLLPRR